MSHTVREGDTPDERPASDDTTSEQAPTPDTPLFDAAVELLKIGFSPIPVKGKVPITRGWTDAHIASTADLWAWFGDDPDGLGIGVACGEVSGRLIVIDIEGAFFAQDGLYERLLNELINRGVMEKFIAALSTASARTPSKGLHVFLRVTGTGALPGNTKLAYAAPAEGAAAILVAETRGQGGQVVVPSPGSPDREWVGGRAGACDVTPEELAGICAAFRALDSEHRVISFPRPEHPTTVDDHTPDSTVADAFTTAILNGTLTWADVLDDGWTPNGYDRDGRSLWIRPEYGGVKTTAPASAKGYERYTEGPRPVLVVHSASVAHLPHGADQRLTPGRVWAACHFDGSEAEAYKALEEAVTGGEVDSRVSALPTAVLDEAARIYQIKTQVWKDGQRAADQALIDSQVQASVSRHPSSHTVRELPAVVTPDTTRALAAVAASDALLAADDDDPLRDEHGLFDWDKFFRFDPGPTDWIVPDLLAAGRLVALYSPAKAGKSLFTLELAGAVASGRDFMSAALGQPRSVLYLDYEMNPEDLRTRLDSLGFTADDLRGRLHYGQMLSLPPLDTPLGGQAVARMAQRVGAELVIVDTTSRTISGDENSSEVWHAWYRHTGMPLKRAGIAVLRLDHSGKDTERGLRGSSAKVSDVDLVVKLTRPDRNGSRIQLDFQEARQPGYPDTPIPLNFVESAVSGLTGARHLRTDGGSSSGTAYVSGIPANTRSGRVHALGMDTVSMAKVSIFLAQCGTQGAVTKQIKSELPISPRIVVTSLRALVAIGHVIMEEVPTPSGGTTAKRYYSKQVFSDATMLTPAQVEAVKNACPLDTWVLG